MAEKTTRTAKPRGNRLDLPMAALAGGSLGFFIFAMPAGLFEGLVAATGLPAMFAAAQPPLGDTARFGFGVAAALAAAGAVWLLLRALERKPAATVAPFAVDMDAPLRLRRADMHPDAPVRHPVRAGVDFGAPFDPAQEERGEPVDVSVVENVDFEAEWERPTPSFLQADATAEAETAEPLDVPFWLPESVNEEVEDEPADEVAPVASDLQENEPVILPFWAQHIEGDVVEEQPAEASLDQLANRLEGGLLRRKRSGRSTRPRGHGGMEERLRGAIEDLTPMSKRR